ncbi:aldehyde ferredoxin oxidoreductase C-terminal domain-containing protein [Paramagnetospirillum magneticum]|uniref:Tungsten-containing aldehyde ferredoxin oxidoreductase n=1 Tax=Paramagnetospirillum magneticum (strain ATCC 700264 / AMB-1) TaxID=342108 RepID=Q2W783_PARM1|nr:aldehyde ferredoxin oxidoreductase C-terminal domain-containing protein [Paramagnetospirillum magneticum]BAE50292.1 Tungsten-containing aldehyde ferredoxin oxidoreductase [Paramagnetospirillum magneticum AMB-1]
MRTHLHVDLTSRTITKAEIRGDDLARAGRYLIARTLLESGVARVDPLGPDNPLIFSAGPYAGTNLSNANRLSVGCKSPLTGGIKEANTGGTFAVALGQLALAGLTLHGCCDEWVVIRITKEGDITFTSAEPYLGKGTFEVAAMLHEAYGKKVSIAQCGPVGERLGLLGGISFSDREGRPARLAARGGVGAVMGSKKVKAIVVDLTKIPELHDRAKVMASTKDYAAKLSEQAPVKAMKERGTAMVGDFTNYVGGMPVRNFSAGQLVDPKVEPLKVGGDYIRERNMGRGGNPSHACMPGCVIQCSNEYVDENGKELVSPLEYETLGLLGTNCGLDDPDDIARLNYICNDLGIDTIETGATMGVLMEAGQGAFGDVGFVAQALADIGAGNERGRLLAQGTARVGEHYGVRRVPVIKKQAISAYDPRVIEVTGVSMMTTAQGADHTTGNLPMMDTKDKSVAEVVEASITAQINAAIADSLGLCVFGRSVTDTNRQLLAEAVNACHGTSIDPEFFLEIGRETLRLEHRFNQEAGFLTADDELPRFFLDEALPPTNKVARFHAEEVGRHMAGLFG